MPYHRKVFAVLNNAKHVIYNCQEVDEILFREICLSYVGYFLHPSLKLLKSCFRLTES